MTIDIANFPDPPSSVDLTVQRTPNSVTITPRTQNGVAIQFQGLMNRNTIGNFSSVFGWAVTAMKVFGGLFMILWFAILFQIDGPNHIKILMGVFGIVFMTAWFGILRFIGSKAGLPGRFLALVSPPWQLDLSRDLWQVTSNAQSSVTEKTYDATSLSKVRFAGDHVIADEFDYDTGQWIQVQLAGPLNAESGQWLASQLT